MSSEFSHGAAAVTKQGYNQPKSTWRLQDVPRHAPDEAESEACLEPGQPILAVADSGAAGGTASTVTRHLQQHQKSVVDCQEALHNLHVYG